MLQDFVLINPTHVYRTLNFPFFSTSNVLPNSSDIAIGWLHLSIQPFLCHLLGPLSSLVIYSFAGNTIQYILAASWAAFYILVRSGWL